MDGFSSTNASRPEFHTATDYNIGQLKPSVALDNWVTHADNHYLYADKKTLKRRQFHLYQFVCNGVTSFFAF